MEAEKITAQRLDSCVLKPYKVVKQANEYFFEN